MAEARRTFFEFSDYAETEEYAAPSGLPVACVARSTTAAYSAQAASGFILDPGLQSFLFVSLISSTVLLLLVTAFLLARYRRRQLSNRYQLVEKDRDRSTSVFSPVFPMTHGTSDDGVKGVCIDLL